jgi:catechol 2,3-dioxygenase-like lactoylglutathione lyase family enzyme
VTPETLDHVALWVADRDPIADFVTSRVGMHVVDRTDAFTLVGSDARRGKLTLFEAEGPREQGALKHVALRVSSLDSALGSLDGTQVERPREGEVYMDVSEGLRLGLVEAPTDVEYDLDHVALWSRTPEETAEEYVGLGFSPASPGPSGVPRVEVESAEEHIAEARERGLEIDNIVDAANTYAVFVWGPERVKVEYVEHKPTFSLT